MNNPNCDGEKCICPGDEVRRLPISDQGAVIVCRRCYEYEIAYRRKLIAAGLDFDLPSWESLEVYK